MRSSGPAPFALAAVLATALACAGASRGRPASERPVPATARPAPSAATPARTAAPAVDVGQELALARAARADGKPDEEARHLERVVGADPSAFDARLELAELLLKKGGDLAPAGRLLGEAAALRPDDARVDRLHGWLDELQGDDAHAIMRYRRVLAVDPDPELRLRCGLLLQNASRYDEALQEFQRVVRDRPTDRVARGAMAQIFESSGRLSDAEAMLAEVVHLAPYESGPLHRLAAFYRRHGETAKAREAETQARSLEGASRSLRPLRPSSH